MTFFSPKAISLGAWSPSKASMLDECALKFHWSYVDKLKLSEEELHKTDDTALTLGSSAHKYAELLNSGRTKEEAEKESEEGVVLTTANKTKLRSMRKGVDSLQERIGKLKEQGYSWDKSELRVSVDKLLNPVDFFSYSSALRGVVDRAIMMEKDGKKHIIAIDIKTGKPGAPASYSLQLESYGVLLHSTYPEISSVQPCLFFTDDNSLVWHTRKIFKRDVCAENPVFQEINRLANAYTPQPEANKGAWCNWCQYKKVCSKK
jgi:CRISPR/Cas system-associated exonuclease Cas4 (RecB family)